jgi:hypothetical protein
MFDFGIQAEVALILWSNGPQGRPLVAEFSFRYKTDGDDVAAKVAAKAKDLFEGIQSLDWCLPAGRTKTQYVYGET